MKERGVVGTWWYAMRPHTLGASVAPLIIVAGALIAERAFEFFPYLLCLIVALSAQIASNIANDYFDHKSGKDTERRIGFERLLSQGIVTPQAMLVALAIAVTICATAGLLLVWMKGWVLLLIGIATILGVFAYSSGPYPLSHHGYGDLAVVLFFGFVPVLGSYYAIAGMPPLYLVPLALGIGMWESNILVVNNYRDYDEDMVSGKGTLVVRMGRRSGPFLYLFNAMVALFSFIAGLMTQGSVWGAIVSAIVLVFLYFIGTYAIYTIKGRRLNSVLAYTGKVAVLSALFLFLSLVF